MIRVQSAISSVFRVLSAFALFVNNLALIGDIWVKTQELLLKTSVVQTDLHCKKCTFIVIYMFILFDEIYKNAKYLFDEGDIVDS